MVAAPANDQSSPVAVALHFEKPADLDAAFKRAADAGAKTVHRARRHVLGRTLRGACRSVQPPLAHARAAAAEVIASVSTQPAFKKIPEFKKMSTTVAQKPFVIARTFNAPREVVFDAFTKPEEMKKWWGPKGFTMLASKMDFKVGGFYHYGMRAPDGAPMWGKFVYREIVRPERIVFINSFSDENGGVTRHPMAPDWPLQMITTFTFEDLGGGKTRFTTTSTAFDATEAERAVFDANHDSMTQGWTGTLDQLETHLAKA